MFEYINIYNILIYDSIRVFYANIFLWENKSQHKFIIKKGRKYHVGSSELTNKLIIIIMDRVIAPVVETPLTVNIWLPGANYRYNILLFTLHADTFPSISLL